MPVFQVPVGARWGLLQQAVLHGTETSILVSSKDPNCWLIMSPPFFLCEFRQEHATVHVQIWKDKLYGLVRGGGGGSDRLRCQPYSKGIFTYWAIPFIQNMFVCFLLFFFGFGFLVLSVFIFCVLVFCLHVSCVGGVRFPGTGVTGRCEWSCGCCELNPGPLEEQPVLLGVEPLLQPPVGF